MTAYKSRYCQPARNLFLLFIDESSVSSTAAPATRIRYSSALQVPSHPTNTTVDLSVRSVSHLLRTSEEVDLMATPAISAPIVPPPSTHSCRRTHPSNSSDMNGWTIPVSFVHAFSPLPLPSTRSFVLPPCYESRRNDRHHT